MNVNKIIFWATSIILVIFEVYSFSTDSHYKWDFFFLMGFLFAVYVIKDKIKLHPFHFFLFASFLILHNLGTFDAYSYYPLGLEFDLYVHGFFGLVSSLILFRSYKLVGPYNGKFVYIAIIAVVLGFSAFHELFEYGGALLFGEGEGVLFIGAGDLDEWDTQKDMFNNLVGAIIGLLFYTGFEFLKRKNGVEKINERTKKKVKVDFAVP